MGRKLKLTPKLVEVKKEVKIVEKEPVVKVVINDRSAYNCKDCKGEGLLNEKTRCPACLGTGKI